MMLRPRQEEFVGRCLDALRERGNTIGVAPTGFGKSVALSAIVGRTLAAGAEKALILQHREELVDQNKRKFRQVNPQVRAGVVTASDKNWRTPATFAMVQTLAREKNLERMPPLDLILIDEGHHTAATSYLKIIDRARELNASVQVCGVTATPQRSDSKGLRAVFDNVADQVTIGELINAGHLVRPRTFVVDIGVQEELRHVRRTANDFDMNEVERIMDHQILNDRIVEEWRKLAGERKTVVFCSTVAHAQHVTNAFLEAGVNCAIVTGDMPKGERGDVLHRLSHGDIQVVCNVAVLVEGFDAPPVSCVVLLRPSSHQSTMIQMIGRGLRTVNPEEFPGVVKRDCIVVDFGTSVLTHGSLEQKAKIDGKTKRDGERAPDKDCPKCGSRLPLAVMECPLCGHEFQITVTEQVEKDALEQFALTEIDLFNQSPFRWESLFNDAVLVADGLDAWAMCVLYQSTWHALGGSKETGLRLLMEGERMMAIAAADDFLREHGNTKNASKSRSWMNSPATNKQLQILGMSVFEGMHLSRYRASCELTWKFNERYIRAKLEQQHAPT